MASQISIFSVLLWIVVNCQPPSEIERHCDFNLRKETVQCIGLQQPITNFDKVITTEAREIYINDSKSVILDSNHNHFYGNIEMYLISRNEQVIFKEFAFQDYLKLKNLICNHNRIVKLHNHSLFGVPRLQFLELSDNNVTKLESETFSTLINLNFLIVRHSQVNQLSSYMFKDLKNLLHLHLENISLTILESNIFYGLDKLQHLSLKFNKLEIIEAQIFNGLDKLQSLDLMYNKIKRMDGNLILPSLLNLILTNNALETFPGELVKNCSSLHYLSLGNNYLTHIGIDMFTFLPKLIYLDLHGNINSNMVNKSRSITIFL